MKSSSTTWLLLATLTLTACGQYTARDIPFTPPASFLDLSTRLTDFASVDGYVEIYRSDQAQIVSFRREGAKATQFSVKAFGTPVTKVTIWACRSTFDQASASRIVERTLSEMTGSPRQITFIEESGSSCSNTELK